MLIFLTNKELILCLKDADLITMIILFVNGIGITSFTFVNAYSSLFANKIQSYNSIKFISVTIFIIVFVSYLIIFIIIGSNDILGNGKQ